MGNDLLRVYASANLSGISCSAYRVLMRMAVVALDNDSQPGADDACLYFGGWRSLTVVLGYGITEDNEPLSTNAEKRITRAIRELRDAGLVELAEKQRQRGHWSRVYYLPPLPVANYV